MFIIFILFIIIIIFFVLPLKGNLALRDAISIILKLSDAGTR